MAYEWNTLTFLGAFDDIYGPFPQNFPSDKNDIRVYLCIRPIRLQIRPAVKLVCDNYTVGNLFKNISESISSTDA